jgi:hypothetical protein
MTNLQSSDYHTSHSARAYTQKYLLSRRLLSNQLLLAHTSKLGELHPELRMSNADPNLLVGARSS